jgi:pimeloyl-ACP methyl ester carboxylesterase
MGMASVPKENERTQQASPDKSGKPTFYWQLTNTSVFDTVKLVMPPSQVLPIVFVPGIMGSNLCTNSGKPIWLLNSTGGQPIGLAWEWARKGPAGRQTILHPKRTKVYAGGDVPGAPVGTIQNVVDFTARGWGEVGQTSYHEFLLWLERKLNGEGFDPAHWSDFLYSSVSSPSAAIPIGQPKLFPGTVMEMVGLPSAAERGHTPDPITSDDLLHRAKFRFPVYACGYNWLESNRFAANCLKDRIHKIVAENNVGQFRCCQVILVTHSMGGLVARACAQLPEMEAKIAGIVHGVMPAVGAAVAYRRCKVGMGDEDFAAGLVIGSNGVEVTAVFAQAPGALQLLPSENYANGWLKINDENGKQIARLPNSDPYAEIYLRKDRWWGLVREEWLKPIGGRPIRWQEFADNIALAKGFHSQIAGKYHPNTFVYYGAGDGSQASFETIRWSMRIGSQPVPGIAPTHVEMLDFSHQQVREDGANNIYLGGEKKFGQQSDQAGFGDSSLPDVETSFRQVRCDKQDGRGDGTVPASSGMFPRANGGPNIRQQFRLKGFSHEPAFKNATAQRVTHYAITKIAAQAKVL